MNKKTTIFPKVFFFMKYNNFEVRNACGFAVFPVTPVVLEYSRSQKTDLQSQYKWPSDVMAW